LNDGLNSSVRHRRTPAAIIAALLKRRNIEAAFRVVTQARRPINFMSRYISNRGAYPTQVDLRTPVGMTTLTVYSCDDIATINEIFFRGDYPVGREDEVIVDFGSNIGVSAAFFLSRSSESFVYCYEPVEQNAERLTGNLEQFKGRYALAVIAVGENTGTVRFGWEPTGKYGGVGRETGRTIEVPCRDSNAVLTEIIERHGQIDVLKIDVETLEKVLVERIPNNILPKIRRLCVEFPFDMNPLAETHDWLRSGQVTVFTLRR
jgi:FkbM family methyltransferase